MLFDFRPTKVLKFAKILMKDRGFSGSFVDFADAALSDGTPKYVLHIYNIFKLLYK